jgi:hypothetical protein
MLGRVPVAGGKFGTPAQAQRPPGALGCAAGKITKREAIKDKTNTDRCHITE